MEITAMVNGGAALIKSDIPVLTDVQSALDIITTAAHQTGASYVIIEKSAVTEEFFDLSTRLAGEILQKFVTYGVRLAIVGDFSVYKSKSLRDFIYESNKGKHIAFAGSVEEAIAIAENNK